MKRAIDMYLDDILQCIQRINASTKNITLEEFENDIDIQDAVMRRIEIIGEAVKQIPQEFKEKHPELPWKKIAGTRDIFTHAYMKVDLVLVWNIIQKDLPPLKKQVEMMLQELDKK